MKLTGLLLAVAIIATATTCSAISDSMQDDSDASESQQQVRELLDMLMDKRFVSSCTV